MRIALPTPSDSEPRPLAGPRNDATDQGGTSGTPISHAPATQEVIDQDDLNCTESEQKHLNQPVHQTGPSPRVGGLHRRYAWLQAA